MSDEFKVRVEGFEGPLELLLSLIEKRKLPINDISLAQVTDDYISHIENQDEFPLSQTSHFILVASTLLLIKSKSLLPNLSLTEEEEDDIENLERRLKMYKRVKELSTHVKDRYGTQILFSQSEQKYQDPVFSPSKDTSISTLSAAIAGVLKSLPKVDITPQAIVEKVISLEEMIENLTERITKNIKMNFSEFSSAQKGKKVEVIVGFLAMLELVKQGIINVSQDRLFDDITMESDNVSTPQYE